jgi:hypothetical protein
MFGIVVDHHGNTMGITFNKPFVVKFHEIPLLAFQDVSILASLAVIPGPH